MPNASGRGECEVIKQHVSNYAAALNVALFEAVDDFAKKNGRAPELQDVRFKGGFTTLQAIIEIEEVSY